MAGSRPTYTRPMHKAFAEFRSALPSVVRVWVLAAAVGGPVCLLIGLIAYRLPLDEAIPVTAAFVFGASLPLLGFVWVRGRAEPPSWTAFLFAAVWFIVLLVPGLVLATLVFILARALFEVA
jgi:hypothetical protein